MTTFDATFSYPQIVSFNSKDRISGTNSSFQSTPVDLGLNKYDSVSLMTASIPKSYYNVPSGYNTFTLTEKSVSTTITIPVGSYNKINLASVLSTLLTAGSTTLGNNWTYVVSNPSPTVADTFKFTFTVSSNGAFQPTITMSSTSPFRQLGFDESTSYPFVANVLVSVNAINLAYVLRMFIKSTICDTSTDGVLAEILSVGSFAPQSVIFYQEFNIDLNTRTFNSTNVNSWEFSIVDSYGQLIDFLGIPWAFTLVFYKRNDTHELHKNELMITNEQRLFNIERTQRQLVESVKNESKKSESESETNTETKTELKSYEFEPQFSIKSNYVIPELINPIDHLSTLNL